MKIYRNEKHGFEIKIPEDWSLDSGSLPVWISLPHTLKYGWNPSVTVQFVGVNESFNINVETMTPELPPDVTELLSIIQLQDMGCVNCQFGRITVEGKSHTWARYVFPDKMWSKKYLIVLGGNGYAMTAACHERELSTQQEKVWDMVASSFRLLKPVDASIIALNQSSKAYRMVAQVRETLQMRVERRSRNLSYGRACDLIEENRYSDARFWLEKCLDEFSDDTIETQVFILNKLVSVSKESGDRKSIIRYRKEIKRLNPSDHMNRIDLAKLLDGCGYRKEAIQEAEELKVLEPNGKRIQELKTSLSSNPRPNYRLRFILSVACFLIICWNVLTKGIVLQAPWLAAIVCLFAAYHLNLSGQWIGLTKKVSNAITIVLHFSTIAILTLFGDLHFILSILFFLPMIVPTLMDSNPKD